MEKSELVMVATPAVGHIVSQVELAKHLVECDPDLLIVILVPRLPMSDAKLEVFLQTAILSLHVDGSRISLIELPALDEPPSVEVWRSKHPFFLINLLGSAYKPVVKRVVEQRPRKTLGILTDMLFTHFVDVAEELGVPSYVLFTSGANMLSMMLHLESHMLQCKLLLPPEELAPPPGFRSQVPLNLWPELFLDKDNSGQFLLNATRFRKTKGILVNTFQELEPEVLLALSRDHRLPPVYSVGPMLHIASPAPATGNEDDVLTWLHSQPDASVVFLCFGTIVSLGKNQVEQIAEGIEKSGKRFLWSMRKQPDRTKGELLPSEYEDFAKVLPKGFLERTEGHGRMIGWTPQQEVLAHRALGGFVSHCGWNSVLESLRFGVPILTWPMYAEQQLNAFSLVREMGVGVELRMDYRYDLAMRKGSITVTATEVETGIRKMMDGEEGEAARNKAKEMSALAMDALTVGGSSTKSLKAFIQHVFY